MVILSLSSAFDGGGLFSALLRRISGDEFGNERFPFFSSRTVRIGSASVMAMRLSYVGNWLGTAP